MFVWLIKKLPRQHKKLATAPRPQVIRTIATLKWKVVKNSPEKIAAEIARLQSELAATDYQVVKSYEYEMTGKKSPYDPTKLHSERQAIRDRITELEKLL